MTMSQDIGPRPRVGFIGAGRIARVLARALDAAGQPAIGIWSRNAASRGAAAGASVVPAFEDVASLVASADVLVLAVSDDAVAEVALELARSAPSVEVDGFRQLYVVASGSRPLTDLAPLELLGHDVARMHVLRSIGLDAGADELHGTIAACSAATPDALQRVEQLARTVGLVPHRLNERDAVLWHAAATIAGNLTVTLLAMARDLARQTGMTERAALDAFGALARAAIDDAITQTPERSLTGPVVRGDVSTIAAHIEALEQHAPDMLDAYRALTDVTAALAVDAGRLDPERAELVVGR